MVGPLLARVTEIGQVSKQAPVLLQDMCLLDKSSIVNFFACSDLKYSHVNLSIQQQDIA